MDGLETLDDLEGVKLCSEQVSKPAGALEQLQQVKREHHPVTQGTVQLTVVEETTNMETGTPQTARLSKTWIGEVMHIYYELVNGKGQSIIPELRHKHSEDQN